MIKIAIVDITRVSEGLERNKIKSVQSNFARLLLSKLFSDFSGGKSMPKIEKGIYGKPFFENSDIFFNISHERNLVALIMSDEGEVGIDLQSLPENVVSREKISERLTKIIRENDYYFTRVGVSSEIKAEQQSFFADSADSIFPLPCAAESCPTDEPKILSRADADFLREWSELEALMKLSGGGFADVGRIPEILAKAKIKSLFVSDAKGTEYALTYAAFDNSQLGRR